MSDKHEAFLLALLSISEKPIDEQWDFFSKLVEEFKPFNQTHIETRDAFYELHSHLVDVLIIDNGGRGPIFDKTQFESFEQIMNKLREKIEQLITQNNVNTTEIAVIKQKINDLEKLVYEKQWKTLSNVFPTV
jgi:hypothetical protein